jgi:hypothetical protein
LDTMRTPSLKLQRALPTGVRPNGTGGFLPYAQG